MLDKQVHLYSIGTDAFYTKKEQRLHWRINRLNAEKYAIQNILNGFGKTVNLDEYRRWNDLKKHKIRLAKELKQQLKERMKRATQKNAAQKRKRLRELNPRMLREQNVISMFESSLTRTIGLCANELSTDLIVVKTFYFQILNDILMNGFVCQGRRYQFFTASAGQTRKKMSVFIAEDVYAKHEKTFMCGLSLDKINRLGGCNANKFNAYLALLNSSTDTWHGFDMARAIVVEDFETMVPGLVDHIDEKDYTVQRKAMEVPVTHTDGAGMMLPSLGKRTCIIRAAWLKGLLTPFAFDAFVREHGATGDITDIWGKKYNIFADNIQVVFTKSQFKMHKYYESWQHYVDCFTAYGCEVGFCKEEERYIRDAVINYQELQTMNRMTDEELYRIAAKSNQRVQDISSNVGTMLRAFGAMEQNPAKTPFQQALLMYPELLQDNYAKNTLRDIKDSLVRSYWSGRLEVNGKYLYLLPDFYAACQHWFLGEANPTGLLADGEVYAGVFAEHEEIDLLRSPHLYFEHGIRRQRVDDKTAKWFDTQGVYTSCHDLISKLLVFDVDGDISLCVVDKTILECAKRHRREYDVVPLYYNMSKAPAVQLDKQTMYNGLIASYTAPSIGEISNSICKIWNSATFDAASLETIKLLCLKNNFSIDFAKTLYFPDAPPEVDAQINALTKGKLPHFFVHLKDKNKTEQQVEGRNNSVVNRISGIIKNPRLRFPRTELEKLDYRVLMRNPDTEICPELIEAYHNLNCKYHYKINHKDPDADNVGYIAKEIKAELAYFGYDEVDVCDMLVKYLFDRGAKGKASLWFCYGTMIVENIKANLNNWYMNCCECGKRFIAKTAFDRHCDCCKEKLSDVRMVVCGDCGITFAHDKRGPKPKRCPVCAEMMQAYWEKRAKGKRRRQVN